TDPNGLHTQLAELDVGVVDGDDLVVTDRLDRAEPELAELASAPAVEISALHQRTGMITAGLNVHDLPVQGHERIDARERRNRAQVVGVAGAQLTGCIIAPTPQDPVVEQRTSVIRPGR